MTKAEKVLRKAAERIQLYGWKKGVRSSSSEKHACLVNAIADVCRLETGCAEFLIPPEAHVAIDTVREVAGGDIGDFNDHHCQSAEDAIAALLIAADLAAEEWKP